MKESKILQQEKNCVAIAEDNTLTKILGRQNVYSVRRFGKYFWAYTTTSNELDKNTIDNLVDYCNRRILTFVISSCSVSGRADSLLIKIKPQFDKWNVRILSHESTRRDVRFFNDLAQRELKNELAASGNNAERRNALLSALGRVKSVVSEYNCYLPNGSAAFDDDGLKALESDESNTTIRKKFILNDKQDEIVDFEL